MTLLFAALGAGFGAIYAAVATRLRRSLRAISHLEREIARDVPTLIQLGEGEHVEFKATSRWDLKQGKVNKALSNVIAKTVAALANHDGGSLLIGVGDDGEITGLELDLRTLKRSDRDGYEQFVTGLVRDRLGGHVCRLVHVLFADVEGREVCRVVVEPSEAPVFFDDGKQRRFFVRTGNASRELDARETLEYVVARWGETRARRSVQGARWRGPGRDISRHTR
ncbi:MAG: AlbA family DNA-binding domain-containing protein [Myxococcota bacterium]